MPGKDDPKLQRERIERIAREIIPDCNVVFDPDQPPSWLRFRVEAPMPATTILGVSGTFHSSEIADWSDDKLWTYIKAIAPHFAS